MPPATPHHSDLPIIRVDPPAPAPALSTREKYGGLFYLGLAGLGFLLFLIAQFGYGVWTLRDHLANVYRLHDERLPEPQRIEAARALARDPRTTQRQLWDDCLDRSLPAPARYLLAEALTPEVMAGQPKSYAATVAKSEGWPDWLRLLLLRPLAYSASSGATVPEEPLRTLCTHHDPMIRLWSLYILTVSNRDADSSAALTAAAKEPGPAQALATLLRDAAAAENRERSAILDRATQWQRTHHPEAASLWQAPGQ